MAISFSEYNWVNIEYRRACKHPHLGPLLFQPMWILLLMSFYPWIYLVSCPHAGTLCRRWSSITHACGRIFPESRKLCPWNSGAWTLAAAGHPPPALINPQCCFFPSLTPAGGATCSFWHSKAIQIVAVKLLSLVVNGSESLGFIYYFISGWKILPLHI